eukprot:m.241380 g.241380  ORF g.241380 m.241380 type:complete len:339 (+) comp33773_c2_seq1:215-1231(+)
MASMLSSATVGDVVADKRVLVDVSCKTSVADVLALLGRFSILSVPVYGDKGGWIGSGGVDVVIGNKQYIGVVSVLDIVVYLLNHSQTTAPDSTDVDAARLTKALSQPITAVIGSTNESLTLWVEPASRSLLLACEQFCKGVHRALVTCEPNNSNTMVSSHNSTNDAKLITQTDVVRFMMSNVTALDIADILSAPVSSVVSTNASMKYVNSAQSLPDALRIMASTGLAALPVLNGATVNGPANDIVSTLSSSDLRQVTHASLLSLQGLSVHDFLVYTHNGDLPPPLSCDASATLNDVVQFMFAKHVHRVWILNKNQCVGVVTLTDVIRAVYESQLKKLS